MPSIIDFVDTLPSVNVSKEFIILQEAHHDLAEDWFKYAESVLELATEKDSTVFLKLQESLRGKTNIFSIPIKAQEYLGIGGRFEVTKVDFGRSNIYLDIRMTYKDLVSIYYGEKDVPLASMARGVIDRFFAYQWERGKLLFPLFVSGRKQQSRILWKHIVKPRPLAQQFSKWIMANEHKEGVSERIISDFTLLLLTTTWHTINDIKSEDLDRIQDYVYANKVNGMTVRKYNRVINNFRLHLIERKRHDITSPADYIKKEVTAIQKSQDGDIVNVFDFVDTEKYPNFKQLVIYGDGFANRLKADGLAIKTITLQINHAKKFMHYLMKYHTYTTIDIESMEKIFSPDSPNNIVRVFSDMHKNGINYALPIISSVVKFLTHCELMSDKIRKNIPRRKKKIQLEPHRNAMSKEMVRDILDILKNRPPSSKTRWSKNHANIEWWAHDEYPIFPLMLLFHYYIPLRGNQVRHLCRANSFIYNSEGKIDKFVINTDKNVNRKYLQEIPCVWDDLQIFTSLLKWHREYFPNLPRIKYQEDDNSPWQDIEPLMILPDTIKPISNGTHINYHKKVLCQYQLEAKAKAEKLGLDHYPIVAWSKTKEPFFETIEELNEAGATRMRNIGVMYDIHSLRVTGATRYLESGVGLATVMELTGHMSAETLTHIYIRLTQNEKKVKLKSAVDQIYFGDKESLVQSGSDLIHGELTRAYNQSKDSIEASLQDNALFSIHRKAHVSDEGGEKSLELGTNIALKKHPTSWIPMIHGICPGVKCPEGREHKCSLCPYLISGKLFIDGVVHQFNRSMADFQRASTTYAKEKSVNYQNHALSEGMETKLEEILGWQEILDKINHDLQTDEEGESDQEIITQGQSVFGMETDVTDLVYLKNAYDAKLMGVEQDIFGLKSLTIMAMRMAAKHGDMENIEILAKDENKAIDMLMQVYVGEIEDPSKAQNFVSSIKKLPAPK